MKKLIKLSEEHYIVVDDSEITEGDYYYSILSNMIFRAVEVKSDRIYYNRLECSIPSNCRKITHSTKPIERIQCDWQKFYKHLGYDKIKQLSLSDVQKLIYGYSVENKAINDLSDEGEGVSNIDIKNWVKGFNAHKELTKDMVKLSDVFKILDLHTDDAPISYLKSELNKFLTSKTEWDVEIDESGKIKFLSL